MKRLRELRKEQKLTTQDLADMIGCSNPTITNYERGNRKPDPDTLIKLAKIFNVTVDYLLGTTDDFKLATIPTPKTANLNYSADELKFLDDFLSLPPNLQQLIRSNVDTLLSTQSGAEKPRKTK